MSGGGARCDLCNSCHLCGNRMDAIASFNTLCIHVSAGIVTGFSKILYLIIVRLPSMKIWLNLAVEYIQCFFVFYCSLTCPYPESRWCQPIKSVDICTSYMCGGTRRVDLSNICSFCFPSWLAKKNTYAASWECSEQICYCFYTRRSGWFGWMLAFTKWAGWELRTGFSKLKVIFLCFKIEINEHL